MNFDEHGAAVAKRSLFQEHRETCSQNLGKGLFKQSYSPKVISVTLAFIDINTAEARVNIAYLLTD